MVKMNTTKNPVDVRIILSLLWVGRMLSGLQGDSTRLHDPVALKELIEGTTSVTVTNDLLLMMSLIFSIPIFMTFLSLTLKYKANRLTNLLIGIFFVLFDLVFLIMFLGEFSYETFWSIVYPIFPILIAWHAWRWRNAQAGLKA